MNRFKDTDYLNISMRIKYLEARLMGSEAFGLAVSSKSPDETLAYICDCLGVEHDNALSAFGFETVIENEESKVNDFLVRNVPDRSLLDLFAIRRDFMNIKAVLKADIRGITPDRMLVEGGTLSKNEIKEAFVKRDDKTLNGFFLSAVNTSFSVYAQTGDPQRIDTVCDRVCFECIKNAADSSPFGFVSDFYAVRIDILNILSFIRQSLMGKDVAFFSQTVLPGGKLFGEKELVKFFSRSLEEFIEHLSHTVYFAITDGFDITSPDLTTLEKNADRIVCAQIKELRKTPFGPQVVAGYILAKEYENKNIRIVMSGVLSGQSSEIIKERLRLGYE